MQKKTVLRVVAFLILGLALTMPQAQASIIINFDDVTAPGLFVDTTALRDHYTPQGITFSAPGVFDGGAILNDTLGWGRPALSGPNFLAFNPSAMLQDGGIPITPEYIIFNSPMKYVSIWATGSFTVDSFTMEAYDSANVLVDTDSVTTQDWAKLEVSSTNISKIILSEVGTGGFAFDNLYCEPVPLPGAFLLLGSGLLGLGGWRRFRKS